MGGPRIEKEKLTKMGMKSKIKRIKRRRNLKKKFRLQPGPNVSVKTPISHLKSQPLVWKLTILSFELMMRVIQKKNPKRSSGLPGTVKTAIGEPGNQGQKLLQKLMTPIKTARCEFTKKVKNRTYTRLC